MITAARRLFEFDDFVSDDRRKYLVVIIYDIIDNKRRNRLSKYLLGYGERVQKSAFECVLNGSQFDQLMSEIQTFITEEDLLRVYKLAGNADIRVFGDIKLTENEEVVII